MVELATPMVDVPEIECVADLQLNNADLIVAFASLEGDMVDQHFGSAQGFYVYSVNKALHRCVAQKHFRAEKKDGNEDKLKPKLMWLNGCDVVYCGSIGGSATRQLIALGITPIKVTGGPDVDELLEALNAQLNGDPEFWLANVLNQKMKQSQSRGRFSVDDAESWD